MAHDKQPEWLRLLRQLQQTPKMGFKAHFLAYFQQQIQIHPLYYKLSQQAQASLCQHLQQRLDQSCQQVETLQTQLQHRPLFGLPSQTAAIQLDFAQTWQKYPVLARLAAQLSLDSLHFIRQFLDNLEADWIKLAQHSQQTLTQVSQIHSQLSDPHHGGKTVIKICFDQKLDWFYKPRSLSMENYFNHCIRALNPHLALSLQESTIISRPKHGWMRAIPSIKPSQTTEYTQRCGYLLALCHTLRGSDFHAENLIQNQNQPILIDLETLLQPEQAYPLSLLANVPRLLQGVLATHLCEVVVPDNQSALTDLMQAFSHAYQAIMQHQPFKHITLPSHTRVIYQDTTLYQQLLTQAQQPLALKNGHTFKAVFKFLKNRSSYNTQQEYAMLCRLDIPYFQAPAARKLSVLSPNDLKKQIQYLQYSYAFQNPYHQINKPVVFHYQAQNSKTIRQQILKCCQQQTDTLLQLAERDHKGHIYWLIPQADTRQGLAMSDDSLYQGYSGILLYLAAYQRIKPNHRLKQFILNALNPLKTTYQDKVFSHRLIQQKNLGLGNGLGSLLYSLIKINQLLPEADLGASIHQFIHTIEPDKIQQDHHLDLLNGTAGLLIALIQAYQLNPQPNTYQLAQQCVKHLLEMQADDGSWQTLKQKGIAGFGHGVSGIAEALLRFYQLDPQDSHQQAACRAIQFENQFFDTTAMNWRASSSEQAHYWSGFCHGATGIGLNRLSFIQQQCALKQSHQDLQHSLKIANTNAASSFDFPCCGETGKLELLLQANPRQAWQKAAWILQRYQQRGSFYLYSEYPAHIDHLGFFKGSTGCAYQLLRLCYPQLIPAVLRFV